MKYSIRSFNRLNVNEIGTLQIQVIDSNTNMPIPNVIIRISRISYTGQFNENAEGMVIIEPYTDYNGMIQIELPALNELIPNNNDFYLVSVHTDQYYSAYIFNVQIYPGITSSYSLSLTPRTEEIERFNFIIQPRTRTVHEYSLIINKQEY